MASERSRRGNTWSSRHLSVRERANGPEFGETEGRRTHKGKRKKKKNKTKRKENPLREHREKPDKTLEHTSGKIGPSYSMQMIPRFDFFSEISEQGSRKWLSLVAFTPDIVS